MRCEPDFEKSLKGIVEVAKYGAALMLIYNGILVGTLGLMRAEWWYGRVPYMADRWHCTLASFDSTPASAALMEEAVAIAREADVEFIHYGKIRPARNGVARMMPRAYAGS